MTRDRGTYQRVEGDRSAPLDDVALASLSRAIAEHAAQVHDNARVIVSPLERDESLWMSELYDHVAAYVTVDAGEFMDRSEPALLGALAERLSVLPLKCVDYDIVWGKKRSLTLYLSGQLAT